MEHEKPERNNLTKYNTAALRLQRGGIFHTYNPNFIITLSERYAYEIHCALAVEGEIQRLHPCPDIQRGAIFRARFAGLYLYFRDGLFPVRYAHNAVGVSADLDRDFVRTVKREVFEPRRGAVAEIRYILVGIALSVSPALRKVRMAALGGFEHSAVETATLARSQVAGYPRPVFAPARQRSAV